MKLQNLGLKVEKFLFGSIGNEAKKENVNMAEPISSTTSFGTFHTDEGLQKAPTLAELAAEPGKYDGTSFDPLLRIVHEPLIPIFSTKEGTVVDPDGSISYKFSSGTFADWFKIDHQAALAWYASVYQFGLFVPGFSANQRAKLGLKG